MIFPKQIHDTIIKIVAKTQHHTPQTLYGQVNAEKDISLSYFYVIINELIEKRILHKENKYIKIHHNRIIEAKNIIEQNKKSEQMGGIPITELKEGEIITVEANTLKELDDKWSNTMYEIILQYSEKQDLYIYNSHPYTAIGLEQYDEELIHLLKTQISQEYILIGNNTPLDEFGKNIIHLQGGNTEIKENHPFMKEGYMVNIIGEYILEMVLPTLMNSHFKLLFDSIKDINGFNQKDFMEIFSIKQECRYTIKRDYKQADILKNEIKEHFH